MAAAESNPKRHCVYDVCSSDLHAPDCAADTEEQRQVRVQHGQHLPQVGTDEAAEKAGDPWERDQTFHVPRKRPGELAHQLNRHGEAHEEQGQPESGAQHQQQHGEPEDGAESQTGQAERGPVAQTDGPQGEPDGGDLVQGVAGNRKQQQHAEEEKKGLGADGFDAGDQSAPNQQGDKQKEVIGLERRVRIQVAARAGGEGP
ncbi:MAG: hypothetical protein NTW28_15495 [Candidatus Solibacter sp.]|nr:hypothetical protein [Candidatus Solibacter sp.]